MKISFKTQRMYDPVLREMAQDAGISVEDLAQISIYNTIALYCREKHPEMVGDGSQGIPVLVDAGADART